MKLRLIAKDFLTYGCLALQGKLIAVFLLLSTPVQAEEITVLALGDSLTQGYGLPAEQGFVPQMQAWLDRQGADITLINGGVSGDTTAGGAARVAWSLTPEVDAMIVALGGNDLLRGIDPAVSRKNLTHILKVAEENQVEVLLVGLPAPTNYGPQYKKDFDTMFPDLASQFGVAHVKSFFGGLEQLAPKDRLAYFQRDRIHPNAKGVIWIVEQLGPEVLQFSANIALKQ